MKPNPKKYLDAQFAGMEDEIAKRGEPDCYIVFKTRSPYDVPEGGPLAVYGTQKGIYKEFPKLVAKTDSKWGIAVFAWWFDD